MATAEDNSRVAADTVLVGASVASLVGVVFALLKAGGETGTAHILIIAVAFLSIVLSWSSVHTVFTLRYARLYYSAGGGIDWHARDQPDFGDFAYVALTLGMTFQVSDTDLISKPIRKAALRHAVLSYVASRPDLKCPGCRQLYQWQDSTHWVPIHPVRAPLRVLH
jgi:uncharacterized membrane protein